MATRRDFVLGAAAATLPRLITSGIGGKTWAPVHQFCERESIPCLLPNVDLPVVAEKVCAL